MKCNILFTGVGGEGVLSTSVIIARAAALAGLEVKGTQLHGLAQRGGSIPIHLRLGKGIYSPIIPRGMADLVIGLEPAEALNGCYYASKKRTSFIIDNYPVIPVYARLNKQKYPEDRDIKRMLRPFAKKIIVSDASDICDGKFGNPVYGNAMIIGIGLAEGLIPLDKKYIAAALKESFPKYLKENLAALELGLEWRGQKERGRR